MKNKTVYVCNACGAEFPKWSGQCTDCNAWNSLVETVQEKSLTRQRTGYAAEPSRVMRLPEVAIEKQERFATGSTELDRVLGGGLVEGSIVLIGGDPGIGKSTMLLQTLCHLAQSQQTLYVTGEESLQQVVMRAKRLGLARNELCLLAETSVENIVIAARQEKPKIIVIDSIQTIYTEALSSAPGGVSQVRESAAVLVRLAKQANISIFLVGHVTKEGALAGPRVLEHMVDCVLYFEGQSDQRYRLLRAAKNRFGAINELGVFAMTDRGLKDVTNPSAIFLSNNKQAAKGSVVMATWEGSRPLLVEIQALVDESHLSNPRRLTIGLEQNRLAMLLAVMHRHGGIATFGQDVFINAVGGVKVLETAADLAILLAVYSSLKNRELPQELIVFGEVGLSGEIRPVPSGIERLKEAKKQGFTRAIVPKANVSKTAQDDMTVYPVNHIQQVFSIINEL